MLANNNGLNLIFGIKLSFFECIQIILHSLKLTLDVGLLINVAAFDVSILNNFLLFRLI
jgi:hypothetical protein